MPMIVVREVRFEEASVVKRHYLPRRILRCEDEVGLTGRGLAAKRGGIPLVDVQNRAEFGMIVRRLATPCKLRLQKGSHRN